MHIVGSKVPAKTARSSVIQRDTWHLKSETSCVALPEIKKLKLDLLSKVGTARCAVRAAFSGAVGAMGLICSARWNAGGDAAARRPYHFA
jgi:hypothetical protein